MTVLQVHAPCKIHESWPKNTLEKLGSTVYAPILPESLEIFGLRKYQTAGSLGESLILLHSVQTVQVCQTEIHVCVGIGLIF